MMTAHDDDEFARIIEGNDVQPQFGSERHRRPTTKVGALIGYVAATVIVVLILAAATAGVVWLWRAVL